MGKTKPRENRYGAGNPRNTRAVRNQLKNDNYRLLKRFNDGLGQREVRRRAAGITKPRTTTDSGE